MTEISFFEGISILIALGSVVFAFFAWKISKKNVIENEKTREFSIFNSVYGYVYDLLNKIHFGKLSDDEKEGWDDVLLNTLEYYSFLVNHDVIQEKKYATFYDDMVIQYHEEILVKLHPDQYKDPKQFEELKKLYLKITNT